MPESLEILLKQNVKAIILYFLNALECYAYNDETNSNSFENFNSISST